MNTTKKYGSGDNDPIALNAKINLLERDLERRQESYIARERAYKTRIDELEEELMLQRQEKTGWMNTDNKMDKLKQLQGQIVKNVTLVQDRTAKILQEQERDLLRAFRARLFDIQTELEKEKSKKEDGAGAWIERCKQLEAELEWAKEVADRLERVNQTLLQENNRLKSQFTSQEEDRNFLIKQLVAVKKDNAKLRAEYSALESSDISKEGKITQEVQPTTPATQTRVGSSGKVGINNGDIDDKYKDINIRLRRLLAEERKNLQQLRQNYALELKNRTEAELLLRTCIEDVRKEIARRHIENASISNNSQTQDLATMYGRTPGMIPIEQFTAEDRERAIELLLSQERVLALLYSKSFPLLRQSSGLDIGSGKLDNEETKDNNKLPAL
jgi:hypothetical protein